MWVSNNLHLYPAECLAYSNHSINACRINSLLHFHSFLLKKAQNKPNQKLSQCTAAIKLLKYQGKAIPLRVATFITDIICHPHPPNISGASPSVLKNCSTTRENCVMCYPCHLDAVLLQQVFLYYSLTWSYFDLTSKRQFWRKCLFFPPKPVIFKENISHFNYGVIKHENKCIFKGTGHLFPWYLSL